MAQGLKAFKTNVFGLDTDKNRQEFIKKFGIYFRDDIKYDIIFMTSGSNKAIETALNLIDFGGKVVFFSSIVGGFWFNNIGIFFI